MKNNFENTLNKKNQEKKKYLEVNFKIEFHQFNSPTVIGNKKHSIVRLFSKTIEEGKSIHHIYNYFLKYQNKGYFLGSVCIPKENSNRLIFYPGTKPKYIQFYNQFNRKVGHYIDHITLEPDGKSHFTFYDINKNNTPFDKKETYHLAPLNNAPDYKMWFFFEISDLLHMDSCDNFICKFKVPKTDYNRRISMIKRIKQDGVLIDLDNSSEFVEMLKKGYIPSIQFYIAKKNVEELQIKLWSKSKKIQERLKDVKIPYLNDLKLITEQDRNIFITIFPQSKNSAEIIKFTMPRKKK